MAEKSVPVVPSEPVEHRLPVDDCPAVAVTVFLDRAEVTRTIKFSPPVADEGTEPSLHVLVVEGMTAHADSDSIRVKPVIVSDPAESGKAVTKAPGLIREVSYAVHHRPRTSKEKSPREIAAHEARDAAQKELDSLRSQLSRVQERDGLVQGYMKAMLTQKSSTTKNQSAAALPPAPAAGTDLDQVRQLLNFHAEASKAADEEVAKLKEDIKKAEARESAARLELTEIRASQDNSTHSSRNVTILLDGPTAAAVSSQSPDGAVTLSMTYIVSGASWAPIYDMRVDDLHAEPQPTSIEVTYAGVIQQTSGEDWNGVALKLSTASTPTGKGAPPLPPTRKAKWAPQYQVMRQAPSRLTNSLMLRANMPQQAMMQQAMMAPQSRMRATSLSRPSGYDEDSDSEDSCSAAELDDQSAPDVEGSGKKQPKVSTTVFVIDRPMTIKADNKEHKCTIGVITCPAVFRLFATPELEELAYIQARATNGGDLTFLPSNRVSVFLNGSFITKTPLKLTSAGEAFTVFLGTEAAVKVEHRVVKDVLTEGSKKGLLRSAVKSSRAVELCTLLNNTLHHPVEITVVHLMPRSTDNKITVSLVSPPRKEVPISGGKSGKGKGKNAGGGAGKGDDNSAGEGALGANSVMQNKLTNNVVFSRTLAPQSKQEIKFEYRVEWPHDANTGKIHIV